MPASNVQRPVTRDWRPPGDTCIILDSCTLIELTNPQHDFHNECCRIFEGIICANSPTLIVPQIVECEVLGGAASAPLMDEALKALKDFVRLPIQKEALDFAFMLRCIYRWRHNVKLELVDSIIGATASIHEDTTRKCTYILTSDTDFRPPFFKEVSEYLQDERIKRKQKLLHLYRPLNYQIQREIDEHQESYGKAKAAKKSK